MNRKILCVDDELNILQGFKRTLRGSFEVYTASSGMQGLEEIEKNGPFAVVMSDMRMPEMDGVEFLSEVKRSHPDTVRIMLTGNSDQETAIKAVNKGSIFRFLNKPASPEILTQTLNSGLEQYRLINAERELLEGTLHKSLQVLVDVLALVNSAALSRSNRVKKMARDIANKIGVKDGWEIEIAAMLSQIGCVTVPEEILIKISEGLPLDDEELRLYQKHPGVAYKLISQIPRMENVAEIIKNQNRMLKDDPDLKTPTNTASIRTIGARILKVVLDYDKLLQLNNLPDVAFSELKTREDWYDLAILNALKEAIDEKVDRFTNSEIDISDLKPGMILDDSVTDRNNTLLLSSGQEITLSLILRLTNFAAANVISDSVKVRIPVGEEELVAA